MDMKGITGLLLALLPALRLVAQMFGLEWLTMLLDLLPPGGVEGASALGAGLLTQAEPMKRKRR